MNKSDRIFGTISLAIAMIFIWRATVIEESFIQDPVGPKIFPIIIGAVMALSSIWFIVKPDADPRWPNAPRLLEIAFAAAVMIAYTYALPEAGFLISTALASAFLSWRLGATPVRAVIAGVVISVGIYVVFKMILGLSLAEGHLLPALMAGFGGN